MISRRTLVLAAFATEHHRMAQLPGGTFLMGSGTDALLRQFSIAGNGLKSMLLTETPAHQVTIPPFQIDRFAVTNADFYRFTRSRPEWRKSRVGTDYLRHWSQDQFPYGFGRLPVVFVSWGAAVAYADWAEKRLPTEAEFEFAARGGLADSKYPWGNEEPMPKRANYRLSGIHGPVPVGSYPPNPYGVFDLVGNVWQFCLDEWVLYSADPRWESKDDLRRMRMAKAGRRVIRGGSFDGDAFNMRVTARDSHEVDHPVAYVGFRCAKSG
jgi:formylglycine-generating enzyme